MEGLAGHYSGRDHVCQWQSGGWIACIPEERTGCAEGTE